MNIHGRKIVLRAVEPSDCEMIKEMFNDPEMESLVVGWSYPISRYAQQKWFENHYNDQNNFRFVIETKENEAVGIATLINIDWKNKRATHGIKLANSEHRAQGIGTDVVMAIMRYAFDELGLHRLDGSWLIDNEGSKHLFAKCGWTTEGIRKDFIYKNGKYKDLIVAGILASEYYKLINENHYWIY